MMALLVRCKGCWRPYTQPDIRLGDWTPGYCAACSYEIEKAEERRSCPYCDGAGVINYPGGMEELCPQCDGKVGL